MERFFSAVAAKSEGEIFWDADQGWELDVHGLEGNLFMRRRDPEHDETLVVVQLSREALLSQIQSLRNRTESIIRALSSAIGRDLWTKHMEWPDFGATQDVVVNESHSWWNFWKGSTNR